MPIKSKRRSSKNRSRTRTRKQKQLYMVGCSKKRNDNSMCPRCGPNCHCGPNCNCPHNCKGNCYLNRRKGTRHNRKMKGGTGCGSCGCPLAPLSWNQMNKYGGSYAKSFDQPVIQNNGEFGPILGIGQNGGMCSACGQIPVQMGGNFYKPLSPVPPPFIGPAWTPEQNNPGNYLSSYSNVLSNDPQLQMTMNDSGYKTTNSMIGGYTYDTKTKSKSKTSKLTTDSDVNSNSSSSKSRSPNSRFLKKGGGLIPQDLVNLGRNFEYSMKSAYNSLNGYKAPVNPLPYKDQLTNTANKVVFV